jgi:predicted Zn-dependent protease
MVVSVSVLFGLGVGVAYFLWHRHQAQREQEDVDALKMLTLGHLRAGRIAEAEPLLDRWCALRPEDALPFKQRMDLRHRRARTAPNQAERQRLMEEALRDGRHALALVPPDDALAQEVVWLLLQVGQLDEAKERCRDCLRRKPGDSWLTYLLASIDHQRGESAEARELLDGLLGQHPGFTRGLLLRVVLHVEAAEPDKAIPLLRQVLALDRSHQQEARYQLSLALARTGQNQEAERVMAEVQKANLDVLLASPHNPEAFGVKLQKAEAFFAAGQEEEAQRLVAALLEQDPGFAPAHALLASYYEKKGQFERAAEHRRRAEK